MGLLTRLWGRDRSPDQPTHRIVIYTRAGCCLCDRAKAIVDRLRSEYCLEVEQIDVDGDPAQRAEFGGQVPVVLIDGQVHAAGKVSEYRLRRALEPPTPET